VIDVSAFHLLLLTVTSWLDRREREVLAYLIEENRILRQQVGGRRLAHRRRSAETRRASLPAGPAGAARRRDDRHAGHVAPLAPAAHRTQMDLRQERNDSSRFLAEIRQLVGRMAEENPT